MILYCPDKYAPTTEKTNSQCLEQFVSRETDRNTKKNCWKRKLRLKIWRAFCIWHHFHTNNFDSGQHEAIQTLCSRFSFISHEILFFLFVSLRAKHKYLIFSKIKFSVLYCYYHYSCSFVESVRFIYLTFKRDSLLWKPSQ